jgi:hypothetical protein
MGMLQGKIQGDTFIIVDTYALPVEGTETRVNAAEGAYEYMLSYLQTCKACAKGYLLRSWSTGSLRKHTTKLLTSLSMSAHMGVIC